MVKSRRTRGNPSPSGFRELQPTTRLRKQRSEEPERDSSPTNDEQSASQSQRDSSTDGALTAPEPQVKKSTRGRKAAKASVKKAVPTTTKKPKKDFSGNDGGTRRSARLGKRDASTRDEGDGPEEQARIKRTRSNKTLPESKRMESRAQPLAPSASMPRKPSDVSDTPSVKQPANGSIIGTPVNGGLEQTLSRTPRSIAPSNDYGHVLKNTPTLAPGSSRHDASRAPDSGEKRSSFIFSSEARRVSSPSHQTASAQAPTQQTPQAQIVPTPLNGQAHMTSSHQTASAQAPTQQTPQAQVVPTPLNGQTHMTSSQERSAYSRQLESPGAFAPGDSPLSRSLNRQSSHDDNGDVGDADVMGSAQRASDEHAQTSDDAELNGYKSQPSSAEHASSQAYHGSGEQITADEHTAIDASHSRQSGRSSIEHSDDADLSAEEGSSSDSAASKRFAQRNKRPTPSLPKSSNPHSLMRKIPLGHYSATTQKWMAEKGIPVKSYEREASWSGSEDDGDDHGSKFPKSRWEENASTRRAATAAAAALKRAKEAEERREKRRYQKSFAAFEAVKSGQIPTRPTTSNVRREQGPQPLSSHPSTGDISFVAPPLPPKFTFTPEQSSWVKMSLEAVEKGFQQVVEDGCSDERFHEIATHVTNAILSAFNHLQTNPISAAGQTERTTGNMNANDSTAEEDTVTQHHSMDDDGVQNDTPDTPQSAQPSQDAEDFPGFFSPFKLLSSIFNFRASKSQSAAATNDAAMPGSPAQRPNTPTPVRRPLIFNKGHSEHRPRSQFNFNRPAQPESELRPRSQFDFNRPAQPQSERKYPSGPPQTPTARVTSNRLADFRKHADALRNAHHENENAKAADDRDTPRKMPTPGTYALIYESSSDDEEDEDFPSTQTAHVASEALPPNKRVNYARDSVWLKNCPEILANIHEGFPALTPRIGPENLFRRERLIDEMCQSRRPNKELSYAAQQSARKRANLQKLFDKQRRQRELDAQKLSGQAENEQAENSGTQSTGSEIESPQTPPPRPRPANAQLPSQTTPIDSAPSTPVATAATTPIATVATTPVVTAATTPVVTAATTPAVPAVSPNKYVPKAPSGLRQVMQMSPLLSSEQGDTTNKENEGEDAGEGLYVDENLFWEPPEDIDFDEEVMAAVAAAPPPPKIKLPAWAMPVEDIVLNPAVTALM